MHAVLTTEWKKYDCKTITYHSTKMCISLYMIINTLDREKIKTDSINHKLKGLHAT